MTDPLLWGRELQVVCDVLRSGGVPAGDLGAGAAPAASQNAPLYSSCADFLYAAEHPAPRFGSGAFLTALDATFAELAGSALAKVDYGKPHASLPLRRCRPRRPPAGWTASSWSATTR
ncbi:phosphoglycolate phosphatase [Aureococcus anophagefferens]|uniref:Phosphoglycolate phosphatase n=1 Tax=Aureococcus anophagefferens TaxID=44056 RepID=A0ABR1G385_AURAN